VYADWKEMELLEKRVEGAVQVIDGLKKREDQLTQRLRTLEEENKRLKVEGESLTKSRDEARNRVQALIDKLKLLEE
jgi:FtsZ-binding cell division protein ZapB